MVFLFSWNRHSRVYFNFGELSLQGFGQKDFLPARLLQKSICKCSPYLSLAAKSYLNVTHIKHTKCLEWQEEAPLFCDHSRWERKLSFPVVRSSRCVLSRARQEMNSGIRDHRGSSPPLFDAGTHTEYSDPNEVRRRLPLLCRWAWVRTHVGAHRSCPCTSLTQKTFICSLREETAATCFLCTGLL